ncbi:hypothetical protein SLE2022_331530 [Rubroshorea leprosula]
MQSGGVEGILLQKKKKGNQLETEKMVQLVIFEADPIDSVANDSINDNNIENCNKGIGVKDKIKCLEALSSRIKELEVLAKGDEMMVLRKLEEMEQRDRERRKKDTVSVFTRNEVLANFP